LNYTTFDDGSGRNGATVLAPPLSPFSEKRKRGEGIEDFEVSSYVLTLSP